MNIIDFIIIYFSIGAPFGVYSYFQIYTETNQNKSLSRAFLIFLFWIPAAFTLINNIIVYRMVKSSAAEGKKILSTTDARLYQFRKQLEKRFQSIESETSIFEFREIIERYFGLTIAMLDKSDSAEISGTSKDFFTAAHNKNINLAAKCLDRRNRQRLFFHQNCARQEFLQIVTNLLANTFEKREFIEIVLEYTDLLSDEPARKKFEKIIVENSFTLKLTEKDLWKTSTQEPPPPYASSISNLLQAATPTTRLPKKG